MYWEGVRKRQKWGLFGSACSESTKGLQGSSSPFHITKLLLTHPLNGKIIYVTQSLVLIIKVIVLHSRKPNKLSVVFTRRSRRVVTEPLPWEPTMKDTLRGLVIWAVPDNQTVAVTLFKDPRTHELEDKDWTFVLEDVCTCFAVLKGLINCSNLQVSSNGKRRQLAAVSINMKQYANVVASHQQELKITMKPTSKKIVSASLEFTICSVLIREGKATWVMIIHLIKINYIFHLTLYIVTRTCKVWPVWWAQTTPLM